jgi:hypothetical protein
MGIFQSLFVRNTVTPPSSAEAMIYIVTKNYDAMKQFFIDLGVRVDPLDKGLKFTPGFNSGRGTAVYLDDMTVCLEEATDTEPSGAIYFYIGPISSECLEIVSAKYQVRKEAWGGTIFITPPDGGLLIASNSEQGAPSNGG